MNSFNIYFPYLYEHEMLYSIFLRNSIHTGISAYSYRRVKDTLGYIEFQNVSKHVDILERYMNYSYSKEELLELTGLYKLFYIFLPYEYQKLALKALKENKIEDMIKAFRFNHQKYNSDIDIKYCPICLKEDVGRYGEPYIHSEHQLKGVKACGKHGCELHLKSIPYYDVCRMITPDTKNLPIEKALNFTINNASNIDIRISQFIVDVLNDENYKKINLQYVNEAIMRLLVEKGYSIKEKNFRTNIADALEKEYGKEIFDYFGGDKKYFIEQKLEYFYNTNLYKIRLTSVEYIVLIIWLSEGYNYFKGMIMYRNIITSVDCDINDIRWLENYRLCLDYYKKYKVSIKVKDIYKGYKIGIWTHGERQNCKKGLLSEYKIKLLNEIEALNNNYKENESVNGEINIPISTESFCWYDYYNLVKEFVNKYEHQPIKDTFYSNVKIGRWFTYQKKRYNKGLLSEDKERLFAEILNVSYFIDKRWESKYVLVEEYMNLYSKSPVRDTFYKEIPIGEWLHNQIEFYKKRKMPDLKIEHFEKLLVKINKLNKDKNNGYKVSFINWGARDDASWEENYQLFKEFISIFNRVPHQREKYKGKSIGMWYCDQIKCFNRGILIHYRKEKMNRFIRITVDYGDDWYYKYKLAEAYYDENGKLPDCYYKVNDVNIGRWLIDQRVVYESGKMKRTRAKLFEKLESTRHKYIKRNSYEKPRDERWDTYYNLTIDYIEEFGYKPPQYKKVPYKGYNLREWVHKQDQRYEKSLLKEDRKTRYKKIYEAPAAFDVIWNRNRCAVLDYINKYNKIPSYHEKYDGTNLYLWLRHQREYYIKGEIPLDRLELYQELENIITNV